MKTLKCLIIPGIKDIAFNKACFKNHYSKLKIFCWSDFLTCPPKALLGMVLIRSGVLERSMSIFSSDFKTGAGASTSSTWEERQVSSKTKCQFNCTSPLSGVKISSRYCSPLSALYLLSLYKLWSCFCHHFSTCRQNVSFYLKEKKKKKKVWVHISV